MSVGGVELRERFGYHPATADTAPKHDSVRQLCLGLAFQLDGLVPDGRDKSLALTALEEVMHWANAAIAKKAPLA